MHSECIAYTRYWEFALCYISLSTTPLCKVYLQCTQNYNVNRPSGIKHTSAVFYGYKQ